MSGAGEGSKSDTNMSNTEAEFQSNEADTSIESADPRGQRAQSRHFKQIEREILQLSSTFMSEISQQSESMIDFLDRFSQAVVAESHAISISDVDVFLNDLEFKVKDVVDMYSHINEANKGVVNPEHEKLLSEFCADVESFKTQVHQRCQEENEILEEERQLKAAKEKLEEQMRAYRIRRANLLRKFESSKASAAPLENQESHIKPTASSTPNTDRFDSSTTSSTDGLNNAQLHTDTSIQGILKTFTDNLAESFSKRLDSPTIHRRQRKSVEPSVFHGDPLEFFDWEVDMDAYVADEGFSDHEALRHLKKFLGGEAKKAVMGLLRYGNEDSYKEAREKLRERYSMEGDVARILLRKLDNWPSIRHGDGKKLREFGDFLDQIRRSMASTVGLQMVETEAYNERICQKLPDNIKFKWTQMILRAKRQKTRLPTFSDFTEFILEQADCYMSSIMRPSTTTEHKPDPPKGKGRYEDRSTRRAAASYQTENKKGPYCYFCDDRGHYTRDCTELAKKVVKERKDFTLKKGLCFCCMNGNHRANICNRKQTCSICKRMHPTLLHDPDWNPTEQSETPKEQDTSDSKASTSTGKKETHKTSHCNSAEVSNASSFSMMVPVYVSAGSNEKLVYALLDTLSDITFIDKQTAEEIGACGIPDTLNLQTMNAVTTSSTFRYENLQVRGYLNDTTARIEAVERPVINCDSNNIPTDEKCRQIPHLKSIAKNLPPKLDIPIGLMIGKDSPEIITPLLTIRGNAGETTACKTIFGWTLCGGRLANKPVSTYRTEAKLFPVVERDFEDAGGKPMSQQDLKFLGILNDGIYRDETGSYVMPLPFESEPNLPNNRHQAEQRLKLLRNKLSKDPSYCEEYRKFMNALLEKGFAEEVPNTEDTEVGKCWYIPHFGVLHPKKGKLRVVFDGSAKYANTCLNNHLLTGPDQLNDLLGILCRFRSGQVAITCDVESMFYNFKVTPHHRDFLRYLWYNDDLSTIKTYRMKVHIFGATSSPGVATFGLRRLAEDNTAMAPEAANFLKDNFYVDDGIVSTDDVDSAKMLVNSARDLCARGNLRLHKFVSNRPEVLTDLPESEKEVEPSSFNSIIPTQRTLGVSWCLKTDQLCFTSNFSNKPYTRRGILSTVAQVYDPIGLVSPFTLLGKKVLQEVCRKGLEWDDPINSQLTEQWKNWIEQLVRIENIRVDRCIKPCTDIKRAELHHFCDASEDGYGACSYLRLIDSTDHVRSSLVLAKSRVAPLERPTMPRMELQGAILATKLQEKLKEELDIAIDEECYWTDSTIVLGYIANEKTRFSPYVTNRVTQIRQKSDTEQWHHVPGVDNPADLASRGATIEQLDRRWFRGPEFLWKEDIGVELHTSTSYEISPEDPELRKMTHANLTSLNQGIKVENFSKWNNLKRAVTQARLIIRRAKDKIKPIWRLQPISAKEMQATEELLIQANQERHFPEEIAMLKDGKLISSSSKISQLSPFLDTNGVMRVGSRASKSMVLTSDEKQPRIISKDSHLAMLLIRHYHTKAEHQGRLYTQSLIRQAGYWIIGAQSLIKSHIRSCVICKRLRGTSMSQKMGLLPKERVEASPPFTHIGVDTFGHFTVKERRTELKKWCIIFTCMYSRAVHIEVVNDLSTESFLQALRCLESIRGPVSTIFSDNGTNFMGSKTTLEPRITFRTNPPGASHQGGVWERGIRMVRNIFDRMKGKYSARTDTAALRTSMLEISSLINSKPLTYRNLDDPQEGLITPHHLITMKPHQINHKEAEEVTDQEIYGRDMYRKTQQFAQEFWDHWQDYLTQIETRQKWKNPCDNLKVGDIVAVIDENSVRGQWKTGVVEETKCGTDGLVRSATIRVADPTQISSSGKRKKEPTLLKRPVQKLLLILSK